MTKTIILSGVILAISVWFFLLSDQLYLGVRFTPDAQKFRVLSLLGQVEYLDQASEKVSISELRDFIKSAYPDEPNDRHELSHKLGELAVKKEGIAGFGFCDSLLQFGCFHGAALTAVRIRGNDPELPRELWEGCKSKAKIPGSCLHGLGHAIVMINQYDLLASYEECERLLGNQDSSFWCEDGVSMENITRSMAPANLGIYGKKDDLYYPCNSIPKRFEAPCVRNHVGHIQRTWGNLEKSLNFCASFVAVKTIKECMNVVGSIIAADYIDDQKTLISECGIVGSYQSFCIEGAVISYSMSKKFDLAEKLCNTLEESLSKACFSKIKSFLPSN